MGGIIEELQQEGEGAAGGEGAVGAALTPQRPPHHGGEGRATRHPRLAAPLPLPGLPRNPGGVLCLALNTGSLRHATPATQTEFCCLYLLFFLFFFQLQLYL